VAQAEIMGKLVLVAAIAISVQLLLLKAVVAETED